MAKIRQNKITRSARGRECTVRIPGVCNWNPETTVGAHVNGGGAGMKSLDIHMAYCCSSCHDAVDRRTKSAYTRVQLDMMLLEGVMRTQKIMVEEGLIEINS